METSDLIRNAVNVECDRQQVGEDRQRFLFDVYGWIRNNHTYGVLTEARVKNIAHCIEPSNRGQYRTTPVTIRGGVQGCVNPSLVSTVMPKWVDYFNDAVRQQEQYTANFKLCDRVIKEFLDIHPFSDGNGRLAWLLRVWMLDQWDNPQPLPNYYGESN